MKEKKKKIYPENVLEAYLFALMHTRDYIYELSETDLMSYINISIHRPHCYTE